MDIFGHLETSVQHLLDRIEALGNAETRARQKLDEAARKCAALEAENLAMRQSLEREQSLRREAMERIDGLVLKIREHAGEE